VKTIDSWEIFGNKRKFSPKIRNYLPNYGKKCGFPVLFSCIFEISRIFATLSDGNNHHAGAAETAQDTSRAFFIALSE
jgi:hypothetical protein